MDGEEQPYLPTTLTAFLAEVISRVSASYHGVENEFISEAFDVFRQRDGVEGNPEEFARLYVDERFLQLPVYGPADSTARRRPTPLEATVETARRLRDLNAVEQVLGDNTIGAILGSSASYGRFYNVIGGRAGKASDLDLLLVVDTTDDVVRVSHRFSALDGVGLPSVELLVGRADSFARSDVTSTYSPIVFSGKVDLWAAKPDPALLSSALPSAYQMSLHIMTTDVFSAVTLQQQPRIAREEVGDSVLVYDYRETASVRTDHQRNFRGGNLRLALDSQPSDSSYVRSSHIFHIGALDDYYPGMFQNLILPQLDVRSGETSLRRAVEAFRWKMVERLRYERRVRPHDFLRISLSHTRSEVFASHVVRSVDASTVLS